MRVPEDLWDRIGAEAEKQDRPRTRLVVEMLQRQIGVVEKREVDPGAFLAIPATEVTKKVLALNPRTTIALTPEQKAQIDEVERCPYTAKQLQGKTGVPEATCQRAIDKGTWRTLL